VLAHRPPISIPRTSVAPALLEELLGEISSLASVYHKPEETFVGRGRVGAEAVQRKAELVIYNSFSVRVSYRCPIGWETTASRHNGQYRLSLLDSRQRTCCGCQSFCCHSDTQLKLALFVAISTTRLQRKASPRGLQQQRFYHSQQLRICLQEHRATHWTISSRSLVGVAVEAEGCPLDRQPVSRSGMVGLDRRCCRLRLSLLRAWRRRWLGRFQILALRSRCSLSRRRTIFLDCFSCVFSLQCLILYRSPLFLLLD
jgi:hypothetical protein